jgi:leucine-rich repeat protein SHOC2
MLDQNQLTSVPAELGKLSSLSELYLSGNQLTSVPAALGNLSSLSELRLDQNQLTSVPAALGRLRERGVDLYLDDGVIIEV